MKKTYIMPAMQADEAQVSKMMAVSLIISDETIDGSEARTKEYNYNLWDIWGEE